MSRTDAVIKDIAEERKRQIRVEKYTSDYDDAHNSNGELAEAAAAYALWAANELTAARAFWPWRANTFKPKDRYSDLKRAAAMLVAEMERIKDE